MTFYVRVIKLDEILEFQIISLLFMLSIDDVRPFEHKKVKVHFYPVLPSVRKRLLFGKFPSLACLSSGEQHVIECKVGALLECY